MLTVSLIAAALAVLASPLLRQSVGQFHIPSGVAKPGPSYHDSLIALSVVQARLDATGELSGSASDAISALTLSLVQGSGK